VNVANSSCGGSPVHLPHEMKNVKKKIPAWEQKKNLFLAQSQMQ
jgi:hypothetical protein